MIAVTCPPPSRLSDYVRGRLELAPHEAIDAHLDDCADCRALVETLDRETPAPLNGLTTPAPDADLDEPTFRRLVERVKAIVPGSDIGSVLGNYELLAPVGAGGMGRVYKARHRRMNRIVALKVLAPELLRSADARARFQREVEAAARVASPHVVAAYDAGEADGRDFLVMEFVEGGNLADLVKRAGPLPVGRALDFVVQAARGLAHAHAAGLVHRDVKPANLLLDQHGTVKVLDLGLARALSGAGGPAEHLTHTTAVMGTPAFMAPEQAADTRAADARADIYGLGCTLYFLLAGRPPFDGATALEVVLAHRDKPIPPIADCPPGVVAFLRTALAKQPADRFPTMAAVVAALERLLGRERTAAPVRRRSWQWAAAAAVVLAASAVSWAFIAAGAHKTDPAPVVVIPDAPTPLRPEAPVEAAAHFPLAEAAQAAGHRGVSVPPHSPKVELVPIEPGEFFIAEMKLPMRVQVTRRFELGKFEVTQEQYEAVMGTNPSFFQSGTNPQLKGQDTRRHPVDSVSWLDAVRFCNQLSLRHGLRPYYKIDGDKVVRNRGPGFRLPTEAEWEYASRAGASTRWSFGDDEKQLGEYAWFAGNSSKQTHSVGEKKPNRWGLNDMYGNVPEWCWDWYQPNAFEKGPEIDPPGPSEGRTRVIRGGAWDTRAEQTRSDHRHSLGNAYSAVEHPVHHIGFRVARDLEP